MRSVLEQMRNCLSSDPWMHASVKTPRCMHACMYSCIHDLSIINMLYAVKKIVTLNPYLPSPPGQGGHCGEIWLNPRILVLSQTSTVYDTYPNARILTSMQLSLSARSFFKWQRMLSVYISWLERRKYM